MTSTDDPLAKIPNADLQRLVTAGGEERTSVLIELDLPRQTKDFAWPPNRIVPNSPAQTEEANRRIDAATAFLTGVLGVAPRWLKSARAFVATVTPTELQLIARSPLVRTIQPNRHLHLGR